MRGLLFRSFVQGVADPAGEIFLGMGSLALPSLPLILLELEGIDPVELLLPARAFARSPSWCHLFHIGSIVGFFEFVNTISVDTV